MATIEQFKLLKADNFVNHENFAFRSIKYYLKYTSKEDVLYELNNSVSGKRILKRWERFADQKLDNALSFYKDQFWEHSHYEVLTDAFMNSFEWYEILSSPKITPRQSEIEFIKKSYKRKKRNLFFRWIKIHQHNMHFKTIAFLILMFVYLSFGQPKVFLLIPAYFKIMTGNLSIIVFILGWLSPLIVFIGAAFFIGFIPYLTELYFKKNVARGYWLLLLVTSATSFIYFSTTVVKGFEVFYAIYLVFQIVIALSLALKSSLPVSN